MQRGRRRKNDKIPIIGNESNRRDDYKARSPRKTKNRRKRKEIYTNELRRVIQLWGIREIRKSEMIV